MLCSFHCVKVRTKDFLTRCDFCRLNKVPTNENFYIRNRNRATFWNQRYKPCHLICQDCLFCDKALEIAVAKQSIFRVYKSRYY